MSLVNYSSSSSDEDTDQINKNNLKKLKLENPLKKLKKNLISKIDDIVIDNPSEHDGRIRSFEHKRGNWATLVYIPINLSIIEILQENIKNELNLNLNINLKNCTDYHISLTKTLVLQHHIIESFVQTIRNELNDFKEFLIDFNDIKIYCNEQKTRTFIGLNVNKFFKRNLDIFIEKFNNICLEYKLEKFYDNPSYHVSILWCVGDHTSEIQDKLTILKNVLNNYLIKDSSEFNVNINKIYCKTGNKMFTFFLKN